MTVDELYVYELCNKSLRWNPRTQTTALLLIVTMRPVLRPIRHSFRTQCYKHSTFIRINRLWVVLAEVKVVPNMTVCTEAEYKKFQGCMKSSFLPGNLELVNYVFRWTILSLTHRHVSHDHCALSIRSYPPCLSRCTLKATLNDEHYEVEAFIWFTPFLFYFPFSSSFINQGSMQHC